jgi:ABC-type molybdate transport system ATPase subunit
MRREGVTASVMIDAGGASFEVHLTPGAIDALRIEEGKEVWLVIKTYSYNLVEPSAR